MLDNLVKYRVLILVGRQCFKGFGVGDNVVFGFNVGFIVGLVFFFFNLFEI